MLSGWGPGTFITNCTNRREEGSRLEQTARGCVVQHAETVCSTHLHYTSAQYVCTIRLHCTFYTRLHYNVCTTRLHNTSARHICTTRLHSTSALHIWRSEPRSYLTQDLQARSTWYLSHCLHLLQGLSIQVHGSGNIPMPIYGYHHSQSLPLINPL